MLLLDTCSFIWLVTNQTELSNTAQKVIQQNKGNIFISAITALELGIKASRKMIIFPTPLTNWLANAIRLHGLTEIPINSKIAILATELPQIHKDPADRIIIATALEQNMKILTPDLHICKYPQANVIW